MHDCPSCGAANADHARFCQSCGTALKENASEGPTRPPATEPEIEYGGFWLRVSAAIIDGLIVSTAAGILTAVGLLFAGFGFALYMVTGWLYEALMTSSERQATIGKMAVGLVVTDDDGERLTFPHATGRYFAKYLSWMTAGIGFVMVAFTERKQGLHDLVASTLVVHGRR